MPYSYDGNLPITSVGGCTICVISKWLWAGWSVSFSYSDQILFLELVLLISNKVMLPKMPEVEGPFIILRICTFNDVSANMLSHIMFFVAAL